MAYKNLRDWHCNSYDQDGRQVDSTKDREASNPNAIPTGHGNGMRSMPSTAADPGRRNK